MVALGTFLVVQWFRLCASSVGAVGSIPGWETKIQYARSCAAKKKKKSLGTSTFRWCLKSGEGEIREGMLCRHMGKRPKTELSGALMLRDWAHEEEPSDETCRSGQQRRQCSERMVPWRQSDGLPQLCASSCFQTLTASVCPAPHEMMGVPRASFPNTGGNQVSPAKKCDGKST